VPDLARHVWPELAGIRPLLLVPVGSTEQHGPHLPLGTDTIIAAALAEAISQARPGVLVAPAIAIGASGEHREFPGTLSIGTEVLIEVLVETVRSARSWTRGVVFVSGHGGNAEALGRAVERSRGEGDEVCVVTASSSDADLHAGRAETSLLLFLSAALVREEAAVAGATGSLSELIAELRVGGVAALSESGVLGDPTGASATEGEHRFAEMRDAGLMVIDERYDS
jgi:creatinine amidohydrolase